MPTLHIEANKEDIAESILLPGDPLRAKYIAENFLEQPMCFNKVRNMLGFTGMYKGNRISVMGVGMGIPSCSIYIHELINKYGVKNLIRVGSAGALQEYINVKDIVIASGACTDSKINKIVFNDQDYAPIANFDLLFKAYTIANQKKLTFHVGNIISTDTFYAENRDNLNIFMKYGVLAIEMEAAALYTLAAKFRVKALAIVTIGDHLLRKDHLSSKETQTSFLEMMDLALETLNNK